MSLVLSYSTLSPIKSRATARCWRPSLARRARPRSIRARKMGSLWGTYDEVGGTADFQAAVEAFRVAAAPSPSPALPVPATTAAAGGVASSSSASAAAGGGWREQMRRANAARTRRQQQQQQQQGKGKGQIQQEEEHLTDAAARADGGGLSEFLRRVAPAVSRQLTENAAEAAETASESGGDGGGGGQGRAGVAAPAAGGGGGAVPQGGHTSAAEWKEQGNDRFREGAFEEVGIMHR
jgi:hypothetical protein